MISRKRSLAFLSGDSFPSTSSLSLFNCLLPPIYLIYYRSLSVSPKCRSCSLAIWPYKWVRYSSIYILIAGGSSALTDKFFSRSVSSVSNRCDSYCCSRTSDSCRFSLSYNSCSLPIRFDSLLWLSDDCWDKLAPSIGAIWVIYRSI